MGDLPSVTCRMRIALARRQDRVAGLADPVAAYFDAPSKGDAHALETVWPGEVVICDPRAGEVRGHRQPRRFVRQNQSWLADRHSRIETAASTVVSGRAVVELVAHLADDGATLAWPIAVVAESPDDRSEVFRTYCSQWPVEGERHLRPPILETGDVRPGDVVARHHAALDVGDTAAIVGPSPRMGTSANPSDPITATGVHLNSARFFTTCFSAGGGVGLQLCTVTDDGMRCALEYNCVRWGSCSHDLPPQAGIGIYERSPDGLLAAVRIYDDVEAPFGHSETREPAPRGPLGLWPGR